MIQRYRDIIFNRFGKYSLINRIIHFKPVLSILTTFRNISFKPILITYFRTINLIPVLIANFRSISFKPILSVLTTFRNIKFLPFLNSDITYTLFINLVGTRSSDTYDIVVNLVAAKQQTYMLHISLEAACTDETEIINLDC